MVFSAIKRQAIGALAPILGKFIAAESLDADLITLGLDGKLSLNDVVRQP